MKNNITTDQLTTLKETTSIWKEIVKNHPMSNYVSCGLYKTDEGRVIRILKNNFDVMEGFECVEIFYNEHNTNSTFFVSLMEYDNQGEAEYLESWEFNSNDTIQTLNAVSYVQEFIKKLF